ncbi:phosphoserine phosphatase SerB [Desertibaculum subflavum]|uniref:phosphoserine phosphatase SerB n=1 Tax=Desertibaculum subflavum TaxID=2268458 RepID=UPI000E6610D0
MQHVLVLIADPEDRPLEAADVALAAEVLGDAAGAPRWLSRERAVEIACADFVDEALLRDAFEDAPIDIAIVPAAQRRKRLLVADMDSTIITVECLDELADFAGLKPKIAAITERAMRGELDFKAALRERVGMLTGLDESALARAYGERVHLTPGARALVGTMRKHGAYAALVSGGFTYFTARVREAAGFDQDSANTLLIEAGRLTGKVAEPILDSSAKLATLQQLTRERGLDPAETLAVGDGANDLPMLQAAGLGVAFRAKPKVAAAAQVRIEHGDLTALLYLQGYADEDFAV